MGKIYIGNTLIAITPGATEAEAAYTKAQADQQIIDLIDGAPGSLDTLKELADGIQNLKIGALFNVTESPDGISLIKKGGVIANNAWSAADSGGVRVIGTYNGVASSSDGSGTGATFNVVVNSNHSARATLASPGTGYAVGETITISDSDIGNSGGASPVAEDLFFDVETLTVNSGEILVFDSPVGDPDNSKYVNKTLAEAGIAPTANPIFTGTITGNIDGNLVGTAPTAPTAAAGTNDTQIATTAFVQSAVQSEDTIAEMNDVTLTSLADGELLVSSSGNFINQTLAEAGIAASSSLTTHEGLTDNPHSVTATQVNLGNVTDESKATMFTDPTFTGSITGTLGTAAQPNITTVGTIGTGTWQGTAIADAYISSASTWNAKQDALTFGTASGNALQAESYLSENDILLAGASNVKGRTYSELKTDLGLENVTNESKATMFTNAVFTGSLAVSGADLDMAGMTINNASNITSTGPITADTFVGTLSTAAQTNITSVGTLTGLTVSGAVTIDSQTLTVDSTNDRVGIGTGGPIAPLHVRKGVTGGNLVRQLRLTNDVNHLGTGSGIVFDMSGLESDGHHPYVNAAIDSIDTESGLRSGNLIFSTRPNDTGGDAAVIERMRINATGEVGIGKTATAGVELDVSGDIKASGTITPGIYADANARDTAITAPAAGMMVFLTAGTKFQGYTGSAWVDLN